MSKHNLKARILILPKKNLRDPQGESILRTLHHIELGTKLKSITKGSLLELTFSDQQSRKEAEQEVATMCEKLLVNNVIERFEIEWQD